MSIAYCCPTCGGSVFSVCVTQIATVEFTEDGEHEVSDVRGDVYWDDNTPVTCDGCGEHDILKLFKALEEAA
jgi:hypothetical protein